jgi:hypothetical protein
VTVCGVAESDGKENWILASLFGRVAVAVEEHGSTSVRRQGFEPRTR